MRNELLGQERRLLDIEVRESEMLKARKHSHSKRSYQSDRKFVSTQKMERARATLSDVKTRPRRGAYQRLS